VRHWLTERRESLFPWKGGAEAEDSQGRAMSSSFWSRVLRSSRNRVGVRMCEEPGQEGKAGEVGGSPSAPDTSWPGSWLVRAYSCPSANQDPGFL
jgi:hypothetical protein